MFYKLYKTTDASPVLCPILLLTRWRKKKHSTINPNLSSIYLFTNPVLQRALKEKLHLYEVNHTQENTSNRQYYNDTSNRQCQTSKSRGGGVAHNNKITGMNEHWSLITLNINGLNSPIKRNKWTEWIRKQYSSFCCHQETNLNNTDWRLTSPQDKTTEEDILSKHQSRQRHFSICQDAKTNQEEIGKDSPYVGTWQPDLTRWQSITACSIPIN